MGKKDKDRFVFHATPFNNQLILVVSNILLQCYLAISKNTDIELSRKDIDCIK